MNLTFVKRISSRRHTVYTVEKVNKMRETEIATSQRGGNMQNETSYKENIILNTNRMGGMNEECDCTCTLG